MQAANVKLAWGLEAETSPTRDTSQAGAGELEGEAGLGRWGGGRRAGSKGLGTTPGEDPARDRLGARMRGPQPLHTPFTYLGKTRAIRGNGRRVRRPWGPEFLGCLFVRLLQLPCLSVGRAVTKATQTSQRDLPLSCLSWSPRKRTQTTERLEERVSQGKK